MPKKFSNNSSNTEVLEISTIVYPPKEWVYRLLGIFLIFLCLLSITLICNTIKENLVQNKYKKLLNTVYYTTAQHGLAIENVIVDGNKRTSYNDLVTALALKDNENILEVDIATLQNKISSLLWVKECTIKRTFFPNNILINIIERKVDAIWQFNNKYYPVDSNGNVLEIENYTPDEPLIILTGDNAPEHLSQLVNVLNTDIELKSRVKAAMYISNRRWNLILDNVQNGITIKLPEKNFDIAYKKIANLNKSKGIFKRKLTSLDIRYNDKIIVDINKSVDSIKF